MKKVPEFTSEAGERVFYEQSPHQPLSLAFSTCPNDTFIFYGLVHGLVEAGNLAFADPVLSDVEELNLCAREEKFSVSKLSFHGLGHVLDKYTLLSAGAALGRGCGPLLVCRESLGSIKRETRIAIPGRYTTASLLLELYLDQKVELVTMRFDRIMEAVSSGEADAGVIIHESRFTYHKFGLHCLCDLGEWWEGETSLPIPLGAIAARTSLGREVLLDIDRAVRASLHYARANPDLTSGYIRQYAGEMDEKVCGNHIRLYVNDFSDRLGREGLEAVRELFRRGRARGIMVDLPLNIVGEI
jgi:1,4-dihydroxy-6-naphthoate synthase